MFVKKIASQFGLSKLLIETLEKAGIKQFYPFQISALNKGILKRKNLVLSLPTASGKTLIAEICMVKSILKNKGGCLCLYIVPLKALANEKYEDFKTKYEPLGINVGIATSDFDVPSGYLAKYNILIATSEKVDSLLRFRAKWLVKLLRIVVLDEIHFIDDTNRGPTLEILIARLRQFNKNIQIFALSATIRNAKEIADWLDADLVYSDWRPVPLKEGVFYLGDIDFGDSTNKQIEIFGSNELDAVCLDTIRNKGQVLIFVNSRRSAQAVAKNISRLITNYISEEEKRNLDELAVKIENTLAESTKMCKQLAYTVKNGVAFHHAGLHYKQRKAIEEYFKQNFIKVICTTPTLAAGVNLPARRVIIRDYKRYQPGKGSVPIPVFEYKQCAGRAGRPKYDKFGESVVMAKTITEYKNIFKEYINAIPEPITSKLGTESALRTHILSSIASGYIYDINGMFGFLSQTFLAYQKQTQNVIEIVSKIFEFLESENMIKRKGFKFYSTAFGNCISRLYIDPISGITIRNGLSRLNQTNSITDLELLYIICACTDMDLLAVTQSDLNKLEIFFETNDLIFNKLRDEIDISVSEKIKFSIIKTSWMLIDWINEEKEDIICDRFSIGPGDIYRLIETAEWLIYSAEAIAKLFGFLNLIEPLSKLKQRIKYGIKEELLDLVILKGIGRVRARNLYRRGFKKIRDIKHADIEKLTKVSKIAENLARDIKFQALKLKI
jgi:helicase